MPIVSCMGEDPNLHRQQAPSRNGGEPELKINPGYSPLEETYIVAPTIAGEVQSSGQQQLEGGNGRGLVVGYSPLEGVGVTVPDLSTNTKSESLEKPSRVERGM